MSLHGGLVEKRAQYTTTQGPARTWRRIADIRSFRNRRGQRFPNPSFEKKLDDGCKVRRRFRYFILKASDNDLQIKCEKQRNPLSVYVFQGRFPIQQEIQR
jgi:hypothetical protein